MSATQNQADFKIEFYSVASTDRNYFDQATNSQCKKLAPSYREVALFPSVTPKSYLADVN